MFLHFQVDIGVSDWSMAAHGPKLTDAFESCCASDLDVGPVD